MKKLLIVGAGGHGRCCLEIAKAMQEFQVISFLDDNGSQKINDYSIVGTIDEMCSYYEEYENIFIAIGNNEIRKILSRKAKEIGYNLVNLIHPAATIMDAVIGDGCICFPGIVIEPQAKVGNGCIITSNSVIHHDAVLEDYVLVYSNTTIRPNTLIGTETRISSNCCIEMNAKIPAGSDIASGSIVKQSNDYSFEVGV